MVEFFVKFMDNKNGIVLDSFAGTGTTGHAVLNLNKKDKGNRNFILIQIDETNKKGTVTRSRVKKTAEQNKQGTNDGSNNGNSKYAGTMAERLLAGRKAVKSHYFK